VILSYAPYSLLFKHPFGLSYGTRASTEVVFVKVSCGSFSGYGEASLPPYLGETQQSVIFFFEKAKMIMTELNNEFDLVKLINEIDALAPGNTAAKAALDIALHDLKAKMCGQSLWNFLKLKKPEPTLTSVTISIGSLEIIPQKIKECKDFEIIKVKLGTENDQAIIEKIRSLTDKKLILDINQGWKSLKAAYDMLEWLKGKDILYLEQPMPKENREELKELCEKSKVPIIADEGFTRLCNVEKMKDLYNGVNIKLMKCTGIKEALEIIAAAKKSGLKINLGCMSESSCAVSAAAQLMGLTDWVDLDGPFLITNDPFKGISYSNGKVVLNNSNGIGAELRENANLNWITN
jgi:L-Ala-D/L-Glu epimerase